MSQLTNTYDVYLPKAKQQVLQKLIASDIKNKLAETEKALVSYFKTQRWWIKRWSHMFEQLKAYL